MENIILELNKKGKGAFKATEAGKVLGEMVIAVADSHLTVFHTEVSPEAEGKGIAKKMLETMVSYARANELKVIPLCLFVQVQFKRHPELYEDIWDRSIHLH